ncbi:hypothetical protein EmuJ_000192700 [Echinococcus multilocularis]|uniref:Uncharacterized protein n=1 Tax=Echinococcus multilocularis TaxID=6211 RepID=A0A087W0G6_ECHMU|nr:hypothetical protein EmuJ_000192700 [Echinococcus multilocularis]
MRSADRAKRMSSGRFHNRRADTHVRTHACTFHCECACVHVAMATKCEGAKACLQICAMWARWQNYRFRLFALGRRDSLPKCLGKMAYFSRWILLLGQRALVTLFTLFLGVIEGGHYATASYCYSSSVFWLTKERHAFALTNNTWRRTARSRSLIDGDHLGVHSSSQLTRAWILCSGCT